MKKRILLLSYCLDLGGSERQLTEIARGMDRDLYEMHVGCMKCDGLRAPELLAAGIPMTRFPMTSFFSFGAVVQSFSLMAYIHRRADRGLTHGIRLRILRASDRIADGIVVNCEFIRHHLIHDEHVPADRIHLCYNGLDEKFFAFQEREAQRPLTIGCVCALRPEKNIALVVDALALLSGCRLLIVGSGPSEAELKERVSHKQLQDKVTFVPANADVPHWLHQIDVFVLASKTEAFSNSLMEAMACGCAVIASDVGGNPELVGRDERGLLFQEGSVNDLHQKLAQMFFHPEMRARKARTARAFIEERLTRKASVARMSEIYEHFLK
jgi:glycosyltransferase involved in cell wall biosynthesis